MAPSISGLEPPLKIPLLLDILETQQSASSNGFNGERSRDLDGTSDGNIY
jgi:hypothetical protein